jgi:hypothetical protein
MGFTQDVIEGREAERLLRVAFPHRVVADLATHEPTELVQVGVQVRTATHAVAVLFYDLDGSRQ